MANGHGGARKGSGRKPKPLAEKMSAGNPGRRPLKKLDIKQDAGGSRPKPPEYLEMTVKPTNMYPSAVEFFEGIVEWLEPTGCLHMIPVDNIANYALAKFFLVEAAHDLTKTRLVVKNDKNEYLVTGFAKAFFECTKTANAAWEVIWQVVRDNSETLVKNPEEDFVAMVSGWRMRRKKTGGDGFEGDDSN